MATNATLHPDLIECVICRETYEDPIDLNCGHNFCRKCLVDYASNIEKVSSNTEKCSCPVCRKPTNLTAAELRGKPGNYTLKNIIEAVQANNDTPVTKCQKHKKDHIIYCETCEDVKCFKCFSENCRSGHVTEDLEEVASQLQLDIQKHLVETSAGNEKAEFPSLNSDLEQLHTIKQKLINARIEDLKKWLRLPHSELVKKRKQVVEVMSPTEEVKKIDAAIDAITKAIKSAQDLINKHKNLLPEPEPTPSTDRELPIIYVGGITVASYDSASSSSGFDVPITVSSVRSNSTRPTSNSPPMPVREFSYRQEVVESIGVLYDDLYVATNEGLDRIGYEVDNVLKVDDVQCSTVIDSSKVLIATSNHKEVHRFSQLERDRPIFNLPETRGGEFKDDIVNVGVIGDYYLFADNANLVIHLWHAHQREWYKPIDVDNLSQCSNPSFRMAVFKDRIYISLRHEGHIVALNISGDVIWRNTQGTYKPNGLWANDDGIFICDPHDSSITLLGLNGQLKCVMLEGRVKMPWSIAVANNRLGVVERPYRVYKNQSIIVKWYNYDSVLNYYRR